VLSSSVPLDIPGLDIIWRILVDAPFDIS
jgi:hypothetical protein